METVRTLNYRSLHRSREDNVIVVIRRKTKSMEPQDGQSEDNSASEYYDALTTVPASGRSQELHFVF